MPLISQMPGGWECDPLRPFGPPKTQQLTGGVRGRHVRFQEFNWRWYPAKSDGQKVKATFPLVIRYKLRN